MQRRRSGRRLTAVDRGGQVDRVGHERAPGLDQDPALVAGPTDRAGHGARVGRLLRGGRKAASDVDDGHAHAHGQAGQHLGGGREAFGWLGPLDDQRARQARDLGHRPVEPGRHEVNGERFDPQSERGRVARRHRELGHGHAEVAGPVADAGQAHAHAHARDAGGGEPAQLGEGVGDHERAVGGRAVQQGGRLWPAPARRSSARSRPRPTRARRYSASQATWWLMPFSASVPQDRRQAVRLVGVGDLDVRPLGAPGRGERPLAIAHDVEIRQPQGRSMLRQQIRDAHV